MATVASEKTRAPKRRAIGETQRRARTARDANRPSPEAQTAHEAFVDLQPFFATKTDLAAALGWSLPTLRHWVDSAPTRPRTASVHDLTQLRDVALAAAKWVSDPLCVGDWLLTPLPELLGSIPARLAVELPREGVDLLINDMVLIAPKQHVSPASGTMSVELLRQTLEKLKAAPIRPRVASGAVDLSDFD